MELESQTLGDKEPKKILWGLIKISNDDNSQKEIVITDSTENHDFKGSVQVSDQITKAKMQGYEGDPCNECGNFTLVRNGTCLKCNTCGGTSGCS